MYLFWKEINFFHSLIIQTISNTLQVRFEMSINEDIKNQTSLMIGYRY
jgi:hypothetical protein